MYNAYVLPTIANTDWHVPTHLEYDALCTAVGGAATAAIQLKESGTIYWNTNNGLNTYGFNGRGTGYRNSIPEFANIKQIGILWCSDANGPSQYAMSYGDSNPEVTTNGGASNDSGLGIRLVKDFTILNPGETSTYVGNDGQVYATICIGTQEWLSKELKETELIDHTPIPLVQDGPTWVTMTTPARCYYTI